MIIILHILMLCRCQDVNGGRRRLTLSTLLSTPLKTPSHAKYPLTRLQQQVVRKAQVRFTGLVEYSPLNPLMLCLQWLCLCFDLVSLLGDTWSGQTFKTLESVSVSGSCRLRRIFVSNSSPTSEHDGRTLVFHHGLLKFMS